MWACHGLRRIERKTVARLVIICPFQQSNKFFQTVVRLVISNLKSKNLHKVLIINLLKISTFILLTNL
jgi:hypothetical protein